MGGSKVRAPIVRQRVSFPKKTPCQEDPPHTEETHGRRRFQIILKNIPPKKTPFSNRLIYPITGLALRAKARSWQDYRTNLILVECKTENYFPREGVAKMAH